MKMIAVLFTVLQLCVLSTALGPGPNGIALTPPMGWMSWEIFRCDTDCKDHPSHCVSEKLYTEMTDQLAAGGFTEVGYNTVSIDDCWEDRSRTASGELQPDPARFPSGLKALGDHMHSKGVRFGIYSDEGTRTCGGFPGSEGYEGIDAKTFASWGVDYLKLDGCYNNKTGFVTGYPAMGTALQGSGRNITYSCSWPAYLGGNETAKPWQAMIDAGCNSWRNWEDIQCDYGVMANIIEHWGQYGPDLVKWAGPGHWHDPDMLLIGNGCISLEEERTQMAIWSVVAAPLIMGNDLRNISQASTAILKNVDAIAVSQDPLGKMGQRINQTATGEVWARPLHGGDVAVALYNRQGGSPAGIVPIATGAFCDGRIHMGNGSGFGYSLATCFAAVVADPKCGKAGFFDYSQSYNGQCSCSTDSCDKHDSNKDYNIFQITPNAPASGSNITVIFSDVGVTTSQVEVYDIWAQKSLGQFKDSFTMNNVSFHGTSFLRLKPTSAP